MDYCNLIYILLFSEKPLGQTFDLSWVWSVFKRTLQAWNLAWKLTMQLPHNKFLHHILNSTPYEILKLTHGSSSPSSYGRLQAHKNTTTDPHNRSSPTPSKPSTPSTKLKLVCDFSKNTFKENILTKNVLNKNIIKYSLRAYLIIIIKNVFNIFNTWKKNLSDKNIRNFF